jgi:hypothetical protein
MINDVKTAAIIYEAAVLLLSAHLEALAKDVSLFENEAGINPFSQLSERLQEYSFKLSTLRGDLKELQK